MVHPQLYVFGDASGADEEVISEDKMSSLSVKQSMLYAAINYPRCLEGRNTELDSKLARIRRRVLRELFDHIQKIIKAVPGNPLRSDLSKHSRFTVLGAVSDG